MKETLQSKCQTKVAPYLVNGASVDADYRSNLKQIHTDFVAASISRLGNNDLLGSRLPPVSPSEGRLTRFQRSTLSQLRSGHCRLLQDYKSRVGQATSDICPECRTLPHTVQHLFDCAAAPTHLSIRDLWINPVAVCDFLCTLSAFSALSPPGPAPPPSPPSPPPSPPPPLLPPPLRPPPQPPPWVVLLGRLYTDIRHYAMRPSTSLMASGDTTTTTTLHPLYPLIIHYIHSSSTTSTLHLQLNLLRREKPKKRGVNATVF